MRRKEHPTRGMTTEQRLSKLKEKELDKRTIYKISLFRGIKLLAAYFLCEWVFSSLFTTLFCSLVFLFRVNQKEGNQTTTTIPSREEPFFPMQPQQRAIDGSSELISELKALVASGALLGEMDERRVRMVAEGILDAYADLQRIASNPYAVSTEPFYASAMEFYRAKYLRQKRCLVTYLSWRLREITTAWWRAQDNRLTDVLQAAESNYLTEYEETMVEYMTSFPVPLDLRAFTWRPPTVPLLEVRGLQDHIYVSALTGETVSIYAGKQILLHFEEAEQLLKQGVMELVKS